MEGKSIAFQKECNQKIKIKLFSFLNFMTEADLMVAMFPE
jgi:hypothetical protein